MTSISRNPFPLLMVSKARCDLNVPAESLDLPCSSHGHWHGDHDLRFCLNIDIQFDGTVSILGGLQKGFALHMITADDGFVFISRLVHGRSQKGSYSRAPLKGYSQLPSCSRSSNQYLDDRMKL